MTNTIGTFLIKILKTGHLSNSTTYLMLLDRSIILSTQYISLRQNKHPVKVWPDLCTSVPSICNLKFSPKKCPNMQLPEFQPQDMKTANIYEDVTS